MPIWPATPATPMTVDSDFPLTSGRATAPALTGEASLPSVPAAARRPWLRGMRARDAVFQKLLVCADLLSAATGIAALALFGGHGVPLASLWTLPFIVVFAKVTGRYGGDELTLHKSTLEELPALLVLAGANALAWSMISAAAGVQTHLPGGGVAVLWTSTAIALPFFRAAARKVAALTAPPERVLIVGSSVSRNLLASSLGRVSTVGLPNSSKLTIHGPTGVEASQALPCSYWWVLYW